MRNYRIGHVTLARFVLIRYICISGSIYDKEYGKMKGTKLGLVAVDAVKHMIGQMQDMWGDGVPMVEIAAWLGVSKPTAKRFIEKNNIGVDVSMVEWRKGHSVRYIYSLSEPSFSAYKRGVYYASYKAYVNEVLRKQVARTANKRAVMPHGGFYNG